jgi:hypothetical protein
MENNVMGKGSKKDKVLDQIPDDVQIELGSDPVRGAIYREAINILRGMNANELKSASDLSSELAQKIENSPKSYIIYQVLLQASKIPSSPIKSRKGRNGGYYFDHSKVSGGALASQSKDIVPKNESKTLEKHLWPLIADWFTIVKKCDNASSEIANLKSGGVWSNPDVVALNIVENLGFFDVEIHTAEVKPSTSNWKYLFFEAVAHKRFSERSYFIYRTNGDYVDELSFYAEKYGVGLVVVDLSDELYDKLPNWKNMDENEKLNFFEAVDERVPAPFSAISLKEKTEFLKRIGISEKKELFSFGKKKPS